MDFSFVNNFLISPDGLRIAWNVNRITNIIEDDDGTAFIKHEVYTANIDGKDKRLVFKEQLKVKDVFADNGMERRMVYWSRKIKNQLFFSTFNIGQLWSEYKSLFALNIETGLLSEINKDVEVFLNFSLNETLVAYTPNDHTCCAGTNYTNNTVSILDLISGKNVVIYLRRISYF
ncbi:MAG: hypothetical protein HZA10_07650 [Nitrospirae bacterium]|nr:hypothetical protein [Nitrospirota bacterium]